MTGTGIEVRAGALRDLAPPPDTRTLLVTDRNVEPLVPPACADLPRHVLEPGEGSKSWSELERLLLALDAAGLDRDGHLLALGGGVVTDLAGLAASLHRRGIDWTAVPTSLVGQVDAAVGGKTGVNLGGGKNSVGSFHLPRRVVVDPGALATLPLRHLRAGLAEVLKTALIAGPELFAQVERLEPDDMARATPAAVAAVQACLATKLSLVADDLHDHGARRALNLGHTFGHAFEALALPELLHGEAVGLGLLCAARLAEGRADGALETRLRGRLEGWGLPTSTSHAVHGSRVLAAMGRDKKRRRSALTLVLVSAPGSVEVVAEVPADAVAAALAAVRPRP